MKIIYRIYKDESIIHFYDDKMESHIHFQITAEAAKKEIALHGLEINGMAMNREYFEIIYK